MQRFVVKTSPADGPRRLDDCIARGAARADGPHETAPNCRDSWHAAFSGRQNRRIDSATSTVRPSSTRRWRRSSGSAASATTTPASSTTGRRQFESHKTVNPNDVENAAWHFLCVARQRGIDAARNDLMKIDLAQDDRVPMAEIYAFYAGRGSEEAVLKAAKKAETRDGADVRPSLSRTLLRSRGRREKGSIAPPASGRGARFRQLYARRRQGPPARAEVDHRTRQMIGRCGTYQLSETSASDGPAD